MRAGKLRHSITVESLTDGKDGRGGLTETWATFAETQARIVPLTGVELERSGRVDATVTHRLELRYTVGITPKMRVNWKSQSRVFDINAVLHLEERQRETHLFVTEHV